MACHAVPKINKTHIRNQLFSDSNIKYYPNKIALIAINTHKLALLFGETKLVAKIEWM